MAHVRALPTVGAVVAKDGTVVGATCGIPTAVMVRRGDLWVCPECGRTWAPPKRPN